jgi:hypothetical protein
MVHQHPFVELPCAQKRRGYFKRLPSGRYDQSIAYTMLYCTECGKTKEVVAADHTCLSAGFSEARDDL